MPDRNHKLQRLIDATEAGIQARAAEYPDAMLLAARIFLTLKETSGSSAKSKPSRLAACNHLEDAFKQARNGPEPIPELTDALAAIEPEFAWSRRPESAQAAGGFYNSHANAIIVGKGGLETRQDVLIGISLVAPDIQYPRHHHPPEELYLVLSPGQWMQNDRSLGLKQSGDLVHNPPNVWHGMQATKTPLLAIWCLWLGN